LPFECLFSPFGQVFHPPPPSLIVVLSPGPVRYPLLARVSHRPLFAPISFFPPPFSPPPRAHFRRPHSFPHDNSPSHTRASCCPIPPPSPFRISFGFGGAFLPNHLPFRFFFLTSLSPFSMFYIFLCACVLSPLQTEICGFSSHRLILSNLTSSLNLFVLRCAEVLVLPSSPSVPFASPPKGQSLVLFILFFSFGIRKTFPTNSLPAFFQNLIFSTLSFYG